MNNNKNNSKKNQDLIMETLMMKTQVNKKIII